MRPDLKNKNKIIRLSLTTIKFCARPPLGYGPEPGLDPPHVDRSEQTNVRNFNRKFQEVNTSNTQKTFYINQHHHSSHVPRSLSNLNFPSFQTSHHKKCLLHHKSTIQNGHGQGNPLRRGLHCRSSNGGTCGGPGLLTLRNPRTPKPITMMIYEFDGLFSNGIYEAAKLYLTTKISSNFI